MSRRFICLLALTLVSTLVLTGCNPAALRAIPIVLLALDELGEDPFLQSAAGGIAGVVAGDGGTVSGDDAGLYGGSPRGKHCDKRKLVRFLRANPAKGKAWAKAVGIATAEIGEHVAGLTPVVLRRDTLVRNHGYRNGKATVVHAVLEAGTAVLVDRFGTPAVKCDCGNPLLTPEEDIDIDGSKYRGKKWKGFSKKKVTVVEKGDEQQAVRLTELNATTGEETGGVVDRPVGTEGQQDVVVEPPPATPCPTPTEGTPPSDTSCPTPTDTPTTDPTPTEDPTPTDDPTPTEEPSTEDPTQPPPSA